MALVDLIDDHRAHIRQVWIAQQPAQQNTGSDKFDLGRLADAGFSADCVADFLAEAPPVNAGHARCRSPGGDTPRLGDDDLGGGGCGVGINTSGTRRRRAIAQKILHISGS